MNRFTFALVSLFLQCSFTGVVYDSAVVGVPYSEVVYPACRRWLETRYRLLRMSLSLKHDIGQMTIFEAIGGLPTFLVSNKGIETS